MNEFKTTLLNEKYSIPVHKNKADLMAELHNINIMGDESDAEMVEPPPPPTKKDNEHTPNGLNVAKNAGDANGPKLNGSHCSNISDASDTSDNSSSQNGDEQMLRWAQHGPDSLSMNVASVLSDHDYLSHDNLIGIITSNEENFELEKQSQLQRKLNDNIVSNSNLSKDPPTDSQKTITYEFDTNNFDDAAAGAATATHSLPNNENATMNDGIDDLNSILLKLKDSKSEEKSALFDQILEKVNKLKLEAAGGKDVVDNVKVEKDTKENKNSIAPNQSISASEFSSNHSEPMEYYGARKFSPQTSVEESKESKETIGEFFFSIFEH